MANFDGRGPEGKGPMTGRGLGPCNKNYTSQTYGVGRGPGRGLGRARRMRRRVNGQM